MATISIYRNITLRVGRKGWLSGSFSLTGSDEVPGEADAAILYDDADDEISNLLFDQFMEMLRGACENPKPEDEIKIIRYLEKHHILKLIDRLCREIYNTSRRLDLISLLDVAYKWAVSSDDVNLVKLGISLMGMMNVDEREDCRKAIVTLGKHEEFTFYSLYAVSGWDDAEEIMDGYAAHLKGWGKKHAELWREKEW